MSNREIEQTSELLRELLREMRRSVEVFAASAGTVDKLRALREKAADADTDKAVGALAVELLDVVAALRDPALAMFARWTGALEALRVESGNPAA